MSQECGSYENDLGELALGVLTGRERARALAHVESCPRCAEELEQLTRAADAMVALAPEAEPPLGFETRLFDRMGVADQRPRHRRRVWVPVSAAAAVVTLALGLGLGLGLPSSSGPDRAAVGASRGHMRTAALVGYGGTVGRVTVFAGHEPWVQMTLDDSGTHGMVHCMVVTDDGVAHLVGSFTTSEGYGAWTAPLHVDPANVRSAEVMSPSGTVIATATLG